MKVLGEAHGEDFAIYNADTVDFIRQLPDRHVDLSVFSPPFSSLYTYSGSDRDMGNCADDAEFIKHYGFMVGELFRITKPGRLCAVHCKDLVDYAGSAGRAGLRDFPGEIIRVHEAAGWKFHSRTTVWKSPVTEMQRTKAHGLLYKQLRSDSTFSRMGLADYILWFRRWAEEGEEVVPVTHTSDSFPLDQWQEWASPVWMTIDQTDVLNVEQARGGKDEKHMCPLQLDLIERVVRLHSNAGETVFSPFAGIGSEGYSALRCGRKFVGVELKPEYFRWAVRNLEAARQQRTFSFYDAQPAVALSEDSLSPRPESPDPARAATERREPLVDASGAGPDAPAPAEASSRSKDSESPRLEASSDGSQPQSPEHLGGESSTTAHPPQGNDSGPNATQADAKPEVGAGRTSHEGKNSPITSGGPDDGGERPPTNLSPRPAPAPKRMTVLWPDGRVTNP